MLNKGMNYMLNNKHKLGYDLNCKLFNLILDTVKTGNIFIIKF
jgi:hypothetical protein